MPSRRVLVLLKGYLGDAVMTTPLLHALRQEGASLHILTEPTVIKLLERTFPDAHFLSVRNISRASEMIAQVRELRALDADTAIVVNRSFRSALAAWLARIPQRVGHRTDMRGGLLTASIPYDEEKNEAESYRELGRLVGFNIDTFPPELVVSEDDKASVLERLEGASVGVQPGARHPYKQVSAETMARVASALQSRGHKVAFLGGPEERAAADAVARRLNEPPVDLVGKCSISETLAATANLKLLIGADTGVMHMAVAVGCPTVTVFGPTVAKKWGHFDPPHQVIEAEGRKIENVSAEEILSAAERALPS